MLAVMIEEDIYHLSVALFLGLLVSTFCGMQKNGERKPGEFYHVSSFASPSLYFVICKMEGECLIMFLHVLYPHS